MTNTLGAIGEATGCCPQCGQQVPAQPDRPEPALRVRFPAACSAEDIARFKEAFLAATTSGRVAPIEFDTEPYWPLTAETTSRFVASRSGRHEISWTPPIEPATSTITGTGPYPPGTLLQINTGSSTEQVVTGRSADGVTEVRPYRPPWWRRLLQRIDPRRGR